MTRVAFLKQLDYLLQDIDERDRRDALDYYSDYMDEAGVKDMDDVNGLLDTPEKIAMSIRSSLNEDTKENGEYGDQGYVNMNVEPENKVPDIYENTKRKAENEKRDYSWADSETERTTYEENESGNNKNNLGKWILIGIICVLGLPVILGVGGGLIGAVFGILGCLIGVIFGVGGGAIGGLFSGVVLFFGGIGRMMTSVPQGILMMGISLLSMAVGILLMMLLILICSRFIPWLIRSIVALFRRLFRRDGGAGA